MPYYTLSNKILLNLKNEKRYIVNLLFVFTHDTNPYKISLDKSDRIIDLYGIAAQNDPNVAYWISLMSLHPMNFQSIDIDVSSMKNEEEIFLAVCAATKAQQKLIINSHEDWEHDAYDGPNNIIWGGKSITILDKDEAILDLNTRSQTTIYAVNSVVACGQSSITDTNNNTDDKQN